MLVLVVYFCTVVVIHLHEIKSATKRKVLDEFDSFVVAIF